jgi:GAF domain-containing protein
METVPAEAGASGALVVPLVGSSGCVGVMSAEVAAGREFDEATRAIATILGAQMATLVHPAAHSV